MAKLYLGRLNPYKIDIKLRAYPDNSLASTGCVGRGLRQAASTMLDIAYFAFLVHNRLARSHGRRVVIRIGS
ncbi:MAG: hypothetical protein IIB56_14480 [Planctomycetes bacterium]|nr:hypothetical protein [Planctomycetota bacterium]